MKIQKIKVKLEGIKPIIFNCFVSIKDEVPTIRKVPVIDGKLAISGDRLLAFLIANKPEQPPGCIKLFMKSTEYKKVLPLVKAYVGHQLVIPVLVDGKEVKFSDFEKSEEVKIQKDKVCGGPVPSIVERPIVENWSLEFQINLVENKEISLERLKEWYERGGIEVGLGASRPVYGQFTVSKFEEIK